MYLYIITIRKVLADFAVCDWWRYCKALCDEKFCQIAGNGRKFSHIELSNKESSVKFFKQWYTWVGRTPGRCAGCPRWPSTRGRGGWCWPPGRWGRGSFWRGTAAVPGRRGGSWGPPGELGLGTYSIRQEKTATFYYLLKDFSGRNISWG